MIMRNCYIKDTGDHSRYISGIDIPCDSDGITRDVEFFDCDFHPASNSVFEHCTINGVPIPNGPGCLYQYERQIHLTDR